MNENDFKQALAQFSRKPADELAMSDNLTAIGVDSIDVFEFTMNVEDATGSSVDVTKAITSVQDLYDCVVEATGARGV
ncbi:MAG TPA: acyl carrier protein [Microlunatus sp.]